jgi:hypothetical protein
VPPSNKICSPIVVPIKPSSRHRHHRRPCTTPSPAGVPVPPPPPRARPSSRRPEDRARPPEDCSLPKELAAPRLRREKEAAEDVVRGLRQELDSERASPETAARSPSGSMALPSAYSSVARGRRGGLIPGVSSFSDLVVPPTSIAST